MSLRAEIDLARGAHRIVAALQVGADETIALVGPNGAGKSSCLAAIAGIERLDGGRIVLHEDVLDGGPGGPFVPPERRNIGVVFQDPLLFPGMSARDNVAYGPVSAGRPRSEARAIAGQWLGRVGIDERHAGARPSALSGGQAQRVALARALASSPRALILDEPLAAVDASARLALRRTLREHLSGFEGPRVIVAHDIADAIALADRIVVLEAGRVVQAGTALELAARPASPYVADLVGLNGLAGRARGRVVEVGTTTLTTADEAEGDVL
ncbi:MAG: ABC transporter ATP-binding protein, partial [Planctomycetota bacterium]